MITEQLILSIYAVLLIEVGLLLLILILIIIDIKNTIDSIRKVIHKFISLGNITADAANSFQAKLSSMSNVVNIISFIPEILSTLQTWSDNTKKDSIDEDKVADDLEQTLDQVVPKKKRRII